jgi:hypothetical protein
MRVACRLASYVLQFVDPWTNNFAYVGRRGTGTSAAGRSTARMTYRQCVSFSRAWC